jgi:AraC-like DNA-binding protein
MVESPDLKLMDIAEQSGFTSASIFSRTFSGITGVTPTEWSKKQKSNQ